MARYLRHGAVRYYFRRTSVGSTMENLNTSILLNMPLLIPPMEDQRLIVARCDKIADKVDRACEHMRRSLVLLQERKQSLITAAVTGEFDVSTASARGVA